MKETWSVTQQLYLLFVLCNRVQGCGVQWISARAPKGLGDTAGDSNDEMDVEGLEEAWEDLNASGQQVTYQKVKELALAHK